MGRDPFLFPRKTRRCRHFDDQKDECHFKSFDCWFAHPDDPEWNECPPRHRGKRLPKGPAIDLERYNGRRRNGAWSRSRSRSRERERDRGWGERARQYRSRSRSPLRRADSMTSSRASAAHGPISPGYRSRESRRASINDNNNNENGHSPLTSTRPFQALPPSPATVALPPPPSPAQQNLPPASSLKLFTPIQRIQPGIVTATSASPAAAALTVPPQPPVVSAPATTTDPTKVHPAPLPEHSSPSPTIPGLTSSTQEPLDRVMSVMSLEDGQFLEDGQVAEPEVPSLLPPVPPLVPLPLLPNLEYESTSTSEISQEAKIEMWNKRIKVFAEALAFKDRIQGLEADIDDLTRYSSSSTFTSLDDDSEEKQRMQSHLEDLLSDRDSTLQDLQKGLDELAVGTTSSDSAVVEWPGPFDIEETQKRNERVKEYVVGLADVMRQVSLTLKDLEEFVDRDDDERKEWKATKRRDKGKEKEVVDDMMDVDKEEVPTIEAVSIPSGALSSIAEGRREEREEGAAAQSEISSSLSSHSREISKIRAKFESLETSIQNVAISLEQSESSWMQGVKELFQDLLLKHKKTVRKHVGKQKQLIEQHATQLKSSLGQVSDNVYTTNAKVQKGVDEISQAIEKISLLERERDSLLEGHKKFFEVDLPELKKSFREYEVQREEDRKRMDVLEAALNAFINRPPGESRNMVNGPMVVSKTTSAMMTSPTTATSSEGVQNSNSTQMTQTPTPTTPILHPITPPASSSTLQQSFLSASTLPPLSSSSSNDTPYLLQNIKPSITLLLREAVKPLLEEVRQKVEEMVSAKGEEMYMTVFSSMQFTWQLLGKFEERAKSDLMNIFNKAITGNAIGAGRIDIGGGGENVGGKGKEKEGGGVVNGNASMDVDSNVNALSVAAGARSTIATMTNGNGTVVSTSSPNVGGR